MSARARRGLLYWALLSPLVVVILFPYLVMLSTALKPAAEVLAFPPRWLPSRPAVENVPAMWQATGFGRALVNSLVVGATSTALALLVGVPAAYALARLRLPAPGAFRAVLLVTQMLAPIVIVLGLFRLVAALGLIDSPGALVLTYAAFNLAFSIWMLQAYFAAIPPELEEAAWIDGATRLQALRLVFLPIAAPAVAVTAIFAFIQGWNEFVLALTLLRTTETYTLPLRIFAMVGGAYRIEWHHVMAATLLATLPAAIVFAWLQRSLVRGLALGAVR
jgi:multiple sugar transport system permease protein